MQRFFCANLTHDRIKPSILGTIIKQLSPESMKQYKKLFFQEINKVAQTDKHTVISPTSYLVQCQEACALSDALSSTCNVLETEEKRTLANLYAKYADALNTFNAKSEELIKDSIEKSLVLDPENQLAKDLETTLNYHKIPAALFDQD